jgi:molybdopterin converting factor subunit 1
MTIRVLLFAVLAQRVGARELTLRLPDGATVGDAVDALCAEHEAIRSMREIIAFAADMEYVERNFVLRDGVELALIPPVSGG